MLTDADVALIRSTRDEMTQHRLKSFDLIRTIHGEEDPFTGNPIEGSEQFTVYGTWSPMTGSGSSGTDFEYVDGVEIMAGDIKANLSTIYDLTGVEYAVRNGIRYLVAAKEPLGLGEDNRYFLLLRRVV